MAFAYTVATNTVVATGGTSGTPLTFANFVTADRAGTGTVLLAPTVGGTGMTLTYPVRPVEFRAIVLKFIVASKTAEADYVYIEGTDAWDVAQTEVIDVVAGNGSYTSTKRWRTITGIWCTDAVDGSGNIWADGTLSVTQDIWGVIWDYGNGQYHITANVEIGDGSTPTYFSVQYEMVDCQKLETQISGNLLVGEIVDDYGRKGSYIRTGDGNSSNRICDGGTVKVAASIIEKPYDNQYLQFGYGSTGIVICKNMIINGHNDEGNRVRESFYTGNQAGLSLSFEDVYINNLSQFIPNVVPDVITNFSTNSLYRGFTSIADITIRGLKITNATGSDLRLFNTLHTLNILDPVYNISSISIEDYASTAKEQYSCNITVKNNAGALLDGVEVLCEDEADATVWTTTTGDTDTGKIDEQSIIYKSWYDTSETLTEYSPHKFTFSKAGYKTLVKENITVDHPIVWEIELQYVAGARNQTVGMGVRMS